jgi:hypothetical protein
VRVDGPLDIAGRPALRLDDLGFSEDGKAKWVCLVYLSRDGDTYLVRAKQYGRPDAPLPLITPDHPDWREAPPQPQSLLLVPGTRTEPAGEQWGFTIDSCLYAVKIARRSFRCLRRIGGGQKRKFDWSDVPVTTCATEEFVLEDGRLLLWRRYNGLEWSERNPCRKSGIYERLAEAGMPILEVCGEKYYLWYDQLPDYALR